MKTECRHCGQSIEYGLNQCGQTVPCPSCQHTLKLPAPVAQPSKALFTILILVACGCFFFSSFALLASDKLAAICLGIYGMAWLQMAGLSLK